MLGNQQIFQHGHAGKQADVLKGAGDARLLGNEIFRHTLELVERALCAREAALAAVGQRFQFAPHRRIAVAKPDASLARLVKSSDAIEHGGLAGAVRPISAVILPCRASNDRIVHRDQPAEAHGQVLDTEQNVSGAAHQP